MSHRLRRTAALSVALATDCPDLPYEFQVVNTDVVNAFAVPGGFIYVNRRLRSSEEGYRAMKRALEELPPPPEDYRVEGEEE